ncbi:DUF2927 domain-containing protein [Chryseobacterium sp. Ch-15]|uniref:DUF2927 domain-containing protein n=1 Tax=Chryseobacterium muglaense TaxID=2893752 RepID=UPI00203EAD40|nr:DUF2927 domain-containing protein [Chryseobacterium muglaense]MCM2556994.1 DUF2927 domain-containing protein [Chryseobacterium muglaense]
MTSKVSFFLILCFMICCNNAAKKPKVDKQNIIKLKKTYSKEVFNFLYELAFYDEENHNEINLSKWKGDLKYFIEGTPSKEDVKSINSTINKLNSLNLSIRFSIVSDIKKANVIIHFGNRSDYKKFNIIKEAKGMAQTFVKNGYIHKGEIVILDEEKDQLKRKSLILEEMTQIIGLTCDTFSHPNSVFYQGENTPLDLTKLDSDVIKLFYEQSLPVNYSIQQFELDFGDILNYSGTNEKMLKLITRSETKHVVLERIEKSCFIDNEFYKHPKYVPIYILNFDKEDSLFVEKSIKAINKISSNLFLKLERKNYLNSQSGITISLIKDESIQSPTETSISNGRGEVFKLKRFESKINIRL